MGLIIRWILGMPVAMIVTVGLFFMMANLIKDRGELIDDPKPNPVIKITAKEPPEHRGPDRPKPPTEIPEELPPIEYEFETTSGPPTNPGPKPAPGGFEKTPPNPGGVQGGPVIRMAPTYPEGCRSRGAEGAVIVEFDVTPEGNVTNARIVQSANACFNRTVLKTVAGWKYPPSSGGMRYGVIERFNFQLVD